MGANPIMAIARPKAAVSIPFTRAPALTTAAAGNAGMGEDGVDRLFIAIDHIDDTLRHTGNLRQFGEP